MSSAESSVKLKSETHLSQAGGGRARRGSLIHSEVEAHVDKVLGNVCRNQIRGKEKVSTRRYKKDRGLTCGQ